MEVVTNLIRKPVYALGSRARRRRRELFLSNMALDANTTVLDLGGGDGSHLRMVLEGTPVRPENVTVADVDGTAAVGGFTKVHLKRGLVPLPFADQSFDVVFCNSVIEHVTGISPQQTWTETDPKTFVERAERCQQEFATEVQRIGRRYWVQTPHRDFPIEAHSWLPFVNYLRRDRLVKVLKAVYPFWVSKHAPDWHLLDEPTLQRMFPQSRFARERFLGLTKSITVWR